MKYLYRLSIFVLLTFLLLPCRASATNVTNKIQVNFCTPSREYVEMTWSNRMFKVEKQLCVESKECTEKVIARLSKIIDQIIGIIPDHARDRVNKIQFYIMYGDKAEGGGYESGLEYFQKLAPQFFNYLDPEWGDSVAIYSAHNYISLSDLWASKCVMHEIAHAWHLQQWPEKQPDILAAYNAAMNDKLYHNVKNLEGDTVDAAYATFNQLEYFAELSCMYFVGCNYHPCNKSELNSYDPAGYKMIEKMWSGEL